MDPMGNMPPPTQKNDFSSWILWLMLTFFFFKKRALFRFVTCIIRLPLAVFFSHDSSFASLNLGDTACLNSNGTFFKQSWYFQLHSSLKTRVNIYIYIHIIQTVHIVYIYISIAYKYACYIILQYVIILRYIHIAYKCIELYYVISHCTILYHIVIM